MDVRNLNTFLHVASLQNLTQASKELGYSQSNVSAQIKKLEQDVGTPLFDRIGRGIFLNSYGEALLPHARRIVSMVMQAENFLKSEESMGGTVRVGMVESLFELLPESAFLDYNRRFPKVLLELTVDANEVLKERLRHGLLDIACLIDDPLLPGEWSVWNTVKVSIVIVANPAHPLASKESVALENLADQKMVLMEDSASYSMHFLSTLTGRSISPQPFLKLQSTYTARRLVELAPFLSVLPLYTVRASAQAGKLRILPVQGWNQSMYVQIVLHRSKILTPQMAGFMGELQTALCVALTERLPEDQSFF